ncbi:MAG: SpoIIE family protein phosphatase [Ignavibacteriae bacterium]|nr:SpoIIE family protein phosphatase [Ignavibacteriota bacterium]
MKITKKIEAEIKFAMNDYWESYLSGNLDHWASYLVNDYKNIGTTEAEIWNSKKEIYDYSTSVLDQMVGFTELRNKKTEIIPYDPYIMVHEYIDIYIKVEEKWIFFSKLRLSSLIQKIDNNWKILHQHGSYPDSKVTDGEFFAFDTLKSENLKLQKAVKDRTEELEKTNRELVIEASLERVRAIALSMKTAADMVKVCETISNQLEILGVNDIRNVQTAIIDEQKGTYLNYQYFAAYKEGVIEETKYNNHPTVLAMVHEMKKSVNSIFSGSMEGKELNNFCEWRKQERQFPDPILDEVDSANYYFYSIGLGGLGLTTYKPLTKADLEIFKRFHKVFSLAYRRFLDIEKAEAQAREAQIEAALERIRGRSLAMHSSEELNDVLRVMFQQIEVLGIDAKCAHLTLMDLENNSFSFRITGKNGAANIGEQIIDLNAMPQWKETVLNWKKAKQHSHQCLVYPPEILPDLWNLIDTSLKSIPAKERIRIQDYPDGVFDCEGHNKFGYIGFNKSSPPTDEEISIVIRFAREFERVYQRFLEIKKAEAQAREAQIEAALERVRARSMAMHSSDELVEASDVMFEQMKKLGIETLRIGICTIDAETGSAEIWSRSEIKGKVKNTILGVVPQGVHPIFDSMVKAWREKKPFFASERVGEGVKDYYKRLSKYLSYPMPKKFNKKESITTFFFIFLSLNVISLEPLKEEECDIMIRFANVFEQTYTRFQDLQKAEAQAREAQIEAALERVRSRSLAMQKSEDLSNVASVTFEQMKILGGDLFSFGIVLCDKHEDMVEQWHSLGNEGMMPPFLVPIDLDYIHRYRYDQWKKGEELFSIEIPADYITRHFELMFELPSVDTAMNEVAAKGIEVKIPDWEIDYGASFRHGYLLVSSLKPFEENQIFSRFAKVFEQAYIRFLDLKKAEAQAKEAQIEAALERVRSKAMAMHSPEDLGHTIDTFFYELNSLGVNPHRCGVGIVNKETRIVDVHATTATKDNEIKRIVGELHLSGHPILEKIFETWLLQEEYHPVLRGNEIADYYRVMNPQVKFPDFAEDEIQYGYYLHFKEGGVFAWTDKEFTENELEIFRRYTSVLSLTYRRYIDLKEAEAQAREANIEVALEKVRSRTMGMQKSEELKEVIRIIYDQFVQLGINIEHTGFIVDYKTRDDMHIWLADKNGPLSEIIFPYFDSPHWNSFIDAKERGLDFFANHLNFKEKNKFYKKLFTFIPDLPEEAKNFYFNCPGLAISTVLLENVGLYIENFSGVPYTDEENKVLMRFGKVFQQTYTRFLDLQKAEEQARQAQIETAMEKVRARALAMQKPEELIEVAQVLRKEMGLLGVEELETSSIYIHDEDSGTTECWYAIQDIREEDKKLLTDHMNMQLKETWVGREMMKFYRSDQNQTSILMKGDNRKEWIKCCAEHSEALQGYYGEVIPERTYHLLKFSNGFMGAASPGEISAQSWELLERATSVFSFAYTRFRDLQQAEERAVEAMRQASLDRVRAEIASMRTTDDLEKITPLIWRELTALGVPFFRCGVFIIDETNELVHAYLSTPEGNSLAALQIKIDKGVWVEKAVQNWRKGQMYYEVWDREKFLSWTQVMMDEGFVENKERFQDGKDAPDNLSLQLLPFNQGMLYIGSEEKLSEEEIELGQKLANDFGIAYSRYEDFQKLEEANNRKSVELEEARQLQLGMLPNETPKLNNIEIAAYMETATEVGGDYYDFNVDEDGSLTVVVGDATGHGMKAGTIVTITKSLFNSSAADSNILETFSKISKVIKEMKFRQLSMCLLMLKIKDYKLSISSAAMPPIFIYRSKTKTVDEILIKGMPLGAISNFPYSSEETNLQKGDNILLMSDGFPELMNGDGEIFGYERTRKLFGKIGNKKPDEIISKFNDAGKKWLNGREPDDDVTFVVIKVK